MNQLERFLAVLRFEEPDVWPLMNVWGLGYIHQAGLDSLHAQGLPEQVRDLDTWCLFFGQQAFDCVEGIGVGAPAPRGPRRWHLGLSQKLDGTGSGPGRTLRPAGPHS